MIGKLGAAVAISIAVVGGGVLPASAEETTTQRVEYYEPGVWIDPDGCAHWAMDDGAEGYMSPIRRRNGTPVCNIQTACKAIDSDQFFATDKSEISAAGVAELTKFFKENGSIAFAVHGHTDSRASTSYNQGLSERRANAVAGIARSVGARVVEIRGYGETKPIASNNTVDGRAQNRRVDIFCVR